MQMTLSVILVYTSIKFLYTRKALDASMSEMMSAPTVQHNQPKNNDTHTIASCVGANISPIHPSMTHISVTQTDTLLICRSQVSFWSTCTVWKKYTENIGKSRSKRIAIEKSNYCSHWRGLHFSNDNYVWKVLVRHYLQCATSVSERMPHHRNFNDVSPLSDTCANCAG